MDQDRVAEDVIEFLNFFTAVVRMQPAEDTRAMLDKMDKILEEYEYGQAIREKSAPF